MHRRSLAAASLAVALLGACATEGGGQEQQGPNTSLEQNNPNAGRPGLEAPDAGSGQQGDAPASGGAAGSGG